MGTGPFFGDKESTCTSPADEAGTVVPFGVLAGLGGGPFGGLRGKGVKMTSLFRKSLIFLETLIFLLNQCLTGTGAPCGDPSDTSASSKDEGKQTFPRGKEATDVSLGIWHFHLGRDKHWGFLWGPGGNRCFFRG